MSYTNQQNKKTNKHKTQSTENVLKTEKYDLTV